MNPIRDEMDPKRVNDRAQRALDWLVKARLTSVKEASQAARALCMWEHDAAIPLRWLQGAGTGDHWEGDNPVRNTARACTALMECGVACHDAMDWLAARQLDNGSWNNDVYDTCYSLITLGGNRAGVRWLLDNCSERWQHPGTVALINSALIHQDAKALADTISRNSSWLLARRTDNNWKYPATSCLVVQSLIRDNHLDEVQGSVDWLLDRIEEGESAGWIVPDVALILITLKMVCRN